MGSICPKNTFLQLKHYIQRIYLTLLSTTCVKIYQIPYVIFKTISYFSRHNSSVLFQLKHIPSKCQFSDFLLLELKFIKFLMSFFKQKKSFSSTFGSLFSAMIDNSSAIFQLNLYMLVTKVAHESVNFQTCHCSHYNLPNWCMSFLKRRASFSSNFASLSSVMRDNSSVLFHPNLQSLSSKRTHQKQIFRLSTARMKIKQIPCHF